MKILVFDNYDSFTYNLVHLVEKILHQRVDVFRNDQLALPQVSAYDKIILSPGPGIPVEAGLMLALIREYAPLKSILGVCLGHQAIGESFGGRLLNLPKVYHGVATGVTIARAGTTNRLQGAGEAAIHPARKLFDGLPARFEAGRYHSWIVSDEHFPEALEVTARDDEGHIMALQHRRYDVMGVQFHPESILTPVGEKILMNWLKN